MEVGVARPRLITRSRRPWRDIQDNIDDDDEVDDKVMALVEHMSIANLVALVRSALRLPPVACPRRLRLAPLACLRRLRLAPLVYHVWVWVVGVGGCWGGG